jgi:hypothetical protein
VYTRSKHNDDGLIDDKAILRRVIQRLGWPTPIVSRSSPASPGRAGIAHGFRAARHSAGVYGPSSHPSLVRFDSTSSMASARRRRRDYTPALAQVLEPAQHVVVPPGGEREASPGSRRPCDRVRWLRRLSGGGRGGARAGTPARAGAHRSLLPGLLRQRVRTRAGLRARRWWC